MDSLIIRHLHTSQLVVLLTTDYVISDCGMAHNWKAATCLLAIFCIRALLRSSILLWGRDQGSCHQLGSSFLSYKYSLTQALLLLGSGVDGYLNPVCIRLSWYPVWSLWDLGTMYKGLYVLRALADLASPLGSAAFGCSGKDVLTSSAFWGSCLSPRSMVSSSVVGGLQACHQWGPRVKALWSHHHPAALGGYASVEVLCSLTQDPGRHPWSHHVPLKDSG